MTLQMRLAQKTPHHSERDVLAMLRHVQVLSRRTLSSRPSRIRSHRTSDDIPMTLLLKMRTTQGRGTKICQDQQEYLLWDLRPDVHSMYNSEMMFHRVIDLLASPRILVYKAQIGRLVCMQHQYPEQNQTNMLAIH